MSERTGLNRTLFWLYEGAGQGPFLFRWLLLILDVAAVVYFLFSPFEYRDGHHWIDYLIGVFFALDLAARFYIARDKRDFWLDWMVWVDLLLIGASFVPFLAANFAFLRVLRVLRAIRRFTFIRHRGEFWSWMTRNERVFDRVMNLIAFVFIAAGVTDFLDGYLARKWGEQSTFGRMLDPIADKLLVSSCLLMLAADESIKGW